MLEKIFVCEVAKEACHARLNREEPLGKRSVVSREQAQNEVGWTEDRVPGGHSQRVHAWW